MGGSGNGRNCVIESRKVYGERNSSCATEKQECK